MTYVDSIKADYGRMKMCHMFADTTEELLRMADQIGVQRKWIQHPGTYKEHFDICLTKRARAVQLGAMIVRHYDRVLLKCGRMVWALQPKRAGAFKMFPWPGPPMSARELAQKECDERAEGWQAGRWAA